MAEKVEVVAEIGITAKDIGGSVKSIKTELREAKAEAIEMARKFGDSSVEATNAAKKVAGLKDEIEDLGIKIKGVNPDKFARLASLGQGVAQGFVAAQGAMALFGGESKDLEKTMIKLQGAIALSQGLQGLKDTKLAFSGMATSAKKAFLEIKAGLTSTGIGAIIVAIGVSVALLVTYWEDITTAVMGYSSAQKEANTSSIAGLEKEIALTKELGNSTSDLEIDMKSLQITKAQMAGDEEAESKLRTERDILYAKQLKESSDNLNKQRDADIKKLTEDNKIIDSARVDLMNDGMAKDLAAQKLAFNERRKTLENAGISENNIEALNRKERASIIKKHNDEAASKKKISDNKALQLQRDQLALENELFANSDKEDKDRKKIKEDEFESDLLHEFDLLEQSYNAKSELKKKEKKDEEDLQKAKFQFIKDSLTAISDLVYLFEGKSEEQHKRAFELQKALSIAQTIISTIESAQAAYKAGVANPLANLIPGGAPALGAIQAAIATAAGLARIKQIKSTTYQSTSAPSTDTGGNRTTAPTTQVSPQQQRSIVGNATGATGTQTKTNDIRVYVTEGDISNTQGRVTDIKRRAVVH